MITRLVLDSKSSLLALRRFSLSRPAANVSLYSRLKNKLFELMSIYEEAIGIKEVRQALDSVHTAQANFSNIQEERRRVSLELVETQAKVRQIRDEMDRLSRTDANYLKLFTEEHGLLKLEAKLMADYKLKEEHERASFYDLSSKLREAQEKEKIRIERTKYLQLGFSILCTLLGMISAMLFNYLRKSNVRDVLRDYDQEHFKSLEDSVKIMIQKQDEFETSIENKLDKWTSSFKLTNESGEPLVESYAESEMQAESEENYSWRENYGKILTNVAVLSVFCLAGGFFFFKNK